MRSTGRSIVVCGLLAALGATLITALPVTEAHACGGCFIPPGQTRSTQVSSHRMVMSIGKTSTTLWDQIQYVGEPSEFAWVLPIHGQVQVGVSSDLFFTTLENDTSVVIHSPEVHCSSPSSGVGFGGTCSTGTKAAATSGGGTTVSQDEGVTVLQQTVVGPYETVQLASSDPMALRTWLDVHGYAVPVEVDPVLDAYVSEGFDFLAVRLVPGNGVEAMQPIRVTTTGASLDLPLRMVAAGTGAFTPITLWVIGEGRYTTANMPEFAIHPTDLVWDFDSKRSNYAEQRAQALTANGGATWLIESAATKPVRLFDGVVTATVADLAASGYGAVGEAQADMDAAIGGLDATRIVVTRLFANLPKAALSSDLLLGASPTQDDVARDLFVTNYTGSPCAVGTPMPDCYGSGGSGGGGGAASAGGSGCGACSVGSGGDRFAVTGATVATLGLVAAAAGRRRFSRRRASRSSRG